MGLTEESTIHIIGHDWGSMMVQYVAKLRPDLFRSVTLVSVPETPVYRDNWRKNPIQFAKSWYIFFFQLPKLPELWLDVEHSGRGLIWLLNYAYGPNHYNHKMLEQAKALLSQPGVL